jgi:hypothetical protein
MHKVIIINSAGARTEYEFPNIETAHGQVGSKYPCVVDGKVGHFEWGDAQQSTFVETEEDFQHFRFEHLPPHLQTISKMFHMLAESLALTLPTGRQRTFAIQQLLVSKDAAVRAKLKK